MTVNLPVRSMAKLVVAAEIFLCRWINYKEFFPFPYEIFLL